MTETQQFANDVNAAYPLHSQPESNDSAWDCVKGSLTKSYFERSPYSSIDCYNRGYIVWNHVVGSQHPVATWQQATALRAEISGRYKTISSGFRC